MIAQVVPLRKLPRHLTVFDYLVPAELTRQIKPFMLVKIPWRSQVVLGVVVSLSRRPSPYQVKPIRSIVYDRPVGTDTQWQLISTLSQELNVSPSHWWKLILPSVPLRPKNFRRWLDRKALFQGTNDLLRASVRLRPGVNLILPESAADMLALLNGRLSGKQRICVLFPEVYYIEKFLAQLPASWRQRTAVIHKRLAASDYFENYERVLKKKARLLVATRSGALLPLADFSEIIVFKSEDYSYKSADQNPRFWTHTALYKLAELSRVKIAFLSLSPRVETTARVQKLRQPLSDRQQPLAVKIVDLGKEFQVNNYTFLSWELEQMIKETLAEKRLVILYVNRKGLAGRMLCRDCGWVPVCSVCQQSYFHVPAKQDQPLLCKWCGASQTQPILCPRCQGSNLFYRGLTNQVFVATISKSFPDKKISYADLDHQPDRDADIIITTKYLLPRLDSRVGLLAVIYADQELQADDYHSQEHSWQFFNNFFRAVAQSRCCLQTFQPEHTLFGNWQSDKAATSFWRREMNWRKKMDYPPYSNLVRLLSIDSDQQRGQQRIEDLYRRLKQVLPASVAIYPPAAVKGRFINKKPAFTILLRYHRETISDYLMKLPNDIIIDYDPYHVL